MPSARSIQDALWHRLCLHGLSVNSKRVLLAAQFVPKFQQEICFVARFKPHRDTLPPHNCRLGSSLPSARPTSVLRPPARLWDRQCLRGAAQGRPHFFQNNHPVHNVSNIPQIYAELHQQARKGQYKKVQGMVKTLVGSHCEKPNHRIYEALVLANTDCSYGSAKEVVRLLQDMEDEGIEPDSAILHAVLRVLAIHPNYLLRSHVLHELRQRWLSLTRDGWHDVVVGLLRDRHLEQALDTLEQMRKERVAPHSWLYDLTIYTLCSAEEFDEALRLLEYCLESGGIPISPILWSHVLDSASRALHYPLTLFAFNARVWTSYLNPSLGICTNILSTAARHGDSRLATSVIQILSRRTGNPIQCHHYEALLETYVAGRNVRTAFMLLVTMRKAGFAPTEASTRPIFIYLRKSRASPKKAHRILRSLRDEGYEIVIQAVNVVIEAYIHHQDLHAALELYKSMQTLSSDLKPDTATFNALLRACALHKRKDIAMFLASEMAALYVTPDALTYDRLILVCLNSDAELDDAWRYFGEIRAAGWWPRGGTVIRFAKEACAKADPRVWDLTQDDQGRGLSKERLDSLLVEHWKGGIEDAKIKLRDYIEHQGDM